MKRSYKFQKGQNLLCSDLLSWISIEHRWPVFPIPHLQFIIFRVPAPISLLYAAVG